MPVLSQYWFSKTDFRGSTEFLSESYSGWAWINWSNIGGTHSTLAWNREDAEIDIDLVSQANNPVVLSTVDSLLGSSAQRTSGMKAGWIPWRYVPFRGSQPGLHADLDLLVRVFFNFHITTPWFCSDADGDISYYVFFFLDASGSLHANVQGWSYHYDGGGPFCTGAISDRLNKAVPAGMPSLQRLLNQALAPFAKRRFSLVYLLPGTAERNGTGNVNVDEHVSLALLP
ncbi:MAG TPA: hypothetical protein VJT72_18570 [Pseudonocardiaceae bacterium]|nr:hypothetical protein [Pseudonocardiaceae bacterium]